MIKKISRKSSKISFDVFWKMVGAFVRTNEMSMDSKWSYWVQKAIFHSSHGKIQTRLHTPCRMIFVKNLALLRRSKIPYSNLDSLWLIEERHLCSCQRKYVYLSRILSAECNHLQDSHQYIFLEPLACNRSIGQS